MLVRAFYFAAYVACIFIPLLVGGGPSVFYDPRAQLAVVIGVVWAIVEASIHPRQFARRWSDLVWVAAAIVGITGAFTSAIFEYIHLPELTLRVSWVALVGLGLAIVGLFVRFAAIRTLGEFFSHELKILQNHRVVQKGLYQHLRHPSYTGFAMICLGIPLVFGAMQIFVIMLGGIAVGVVFRILIEEQILLDHFGDEYRAYQKRTKRLIPFVW